MALPETATILAAIGTIAGSSFAAFLAARADKRTKKVQTEVEGPGNEPSIRQMIQAVQDTQASAHDRLHRDLVHVDDRLAGVEQVVYKGMENRVQNLEQRTTHVDLIATTIKGLDARLSAVQGEMARAGVNIHIIANVCQAKLATPEEANAIIAQREADRKPGPGGIPQPAG